MTITTQADRLAEQIKEAMRASLMNDKVEAKMAAAVDTLASLAKQKASRLGWPCEIETADFEANTITVKMLGNDYWVAAGRHVLIPLAQKKP